VGGWMVHFLENFPKSCDFQEVFGFLSKNFQFFDFFGKLSKNFCYLCGIKDNLKR